MIAACSHFVLAFSDRSLRLRDCLEGVPAAEFISDSSLRDTEGN